MAKLTLVINGMNRADHALADAFRAAGLSVRVRDLCGEVLNAVTLSRRDHAERRKWTIPNGERRGVYPRRGP